MESLPYELLHILYDYLPIKSKARLSMVYKYTYIHAPKYILLHVGEFIHSIRIIQSIKYSYCLVRPNSSYGDISNNAISIRILDGSRQKVSYELTFYGIYDIQFLPLWHTSFGEEIGDILDLKFVNIY